MVVEIGSFRWNCIQWTEIRHPIKRRNNEPVTKVLRGTVQEGSRDCTFDYNIMSITSKVRKIKMIFKKF